MKISCIPTSCLENKKISVQTPPTQVVYAAGDAFNPNGMVILRDDVLRGHDPDTYLDEGDTLNRNDTYEQISLYIFKHREKTNQPITVS